MAKYPLEFKRKVCQEYRDGKGGYKALAEKFGVKNKKQVQDWVNIYQLFGKEKFSCASEEITFILVNLS